MEDCDFIPTRYREAHTLKRAIRLRASCVGLLIAIMLVWAVVHKHRLASERAMMPDVARQHEQIAIHLAKKEAMEAERAALRNHRRLIEQLRGDLDLVVVFSDISRRMPETVVLTELSVHCPSLRRYAVKEEDDLQRGRPTPPASRQARSDRQLEDELTVDRITMNGIAREIPEVIGFAAALEDSELLSRVQMEMGEATAWAGREARRFELTCDLAKQVGGSW
ncbi:MAG: PilN domain-containing protein [Phycisphaerae bacterium]|nr:PilN domain-containing protein [Phycisphaerae bacterium]